MEKQTISNIQFKRGTKSALESKLAGELKPLKGEPIWEIDSNKIRIGDGINDYKDLPYINMTADDEDLVIEGYYINNTFYTTEKAITFSPRRINKIYKDLLTNSLYYYKLTDGFNPLMVLYQSVGYNEENIYAADSLRAYVNADEQYYNRILAESDFEAMLETGIYKKNTYIVLEQK